MNKKDKFTQLYTWYTALVVVLGLSILFQLWIFKEIAKIKRASESKYYTLPTDQELKSIEYGRE
jgi:hypothetical protein